MFAHVYNTAYDWIPEQSRVLDLGTGDGEFLARLVHEKGLEAEGVEKDAEMVARCIENGVVVHQGDVIDGLDQYEDDSFDFILMIGTFQELSRPHGILQEAFRVGKRIIIGYHNFAYWKIRFKLMFEGRVPMTNSMPYLWYQSPNTMFFSIIDFEVMCENFGYVVERSAYFNTRGRVWPAPNFFGEQVLVEFRPENNPV